MMEFLMLVPESVGELVDHMGWMILTAPEFKSSMVPNGNLAMAFEELNAGISSLCPKFGAVGCEEMKEMSNEARSLFEQKKTLEANYVLQDMMEYLREKKWKKHT